MGERISSLSAILLDERYYELLHRHTRDIEGISIVSEEGLIPLKARAWGVLGYDQASRAIADFKRELLARNEATPLFGNLREEALEGIFASLEQRMFGDSLYRLREEKAAHLLYFIVNDYPFTDGNTRIGSFLFLLYLQQEGVPHRLTPEGLTALTLLLADSAPSTKELMIRLIINLLVESEL